MPLAMRAVSGATRGERIFEAADYVYVVSEGCLSDPVLVMNHPDVEALARAVTRLERHSVAPSAGASAPP